MPNNWFQFKQFRVEQARAAFKVGTDGSILGAWAPVENAQLILDIGTGTGLIALMMAQRNPNAKIIAIEPDEDSFREATMNFSQSHWKDRLECVRDTLQAYVNTTPAKFDLIVSNPPFFSQSMVGSVARINNARHETTLNISTLLKDAAKLIAPAGKLVLILPVERRADLLKHGKQNHWHESLCLWIKPNEEKGHNRFITVLERSPAKSTEMELVVYQGQHQYTEETTELLRPFYLRL